MKKINAPLRILIVDDEAPARNRARRLLEKIEGVEIMGEAKSGREALEIIESAEPDVVLLDIQMPDLTGLRVLEALDDPPAVIFSTAYDNYAVDAFELEAVDYLLKPYSAERLEKAVRRAGKFLTGVEGSPGKSGDLKIPAENGLATDLVPIEKCVGFQIIESVVFLMKEGGEKLTCEKTLQEIESMLPPDGFFRISRQAIINLAAVKSIKPAKEGGLEIQLRSGFKEFASRRRARHLKSRLGL